MKIQPINNMQTSYKARFPKTDILPLAERAENTVAGMPKLYTLLEFLDKLPGNKAKFVRKEAGSNYEPIGYKSIFNYLLTIDEKIVGRSPIDNWSALCDACIDDKILQRSKYIHMPMSVFENKWWKNLDKTKEDIMKFAIDA